MRNNNLKRFLTTASALGMIAAGAGEASAAAGAGVYIIHGGDVTSAAVGGVNFKTQADLVVDAGNPLGAAIAYDLVYAGTGAARTFAQDVDGMTITSINTSSGINGTPATVAPGVMTVTGTTSIGSIKVGTVANSLLNIAVTNAKVLTLTGSASTSGPLAAANNNAPAFVPVAANIYDGLGTVTLSNANAGLTIGANVDNQMFKGDIIANANHDGLLVISAGAAGNIFTGDIGGAANMLAGTTVSESVTFAPAAGKAVVNLGPTTVGAGKTLAIDSTNVTAAATVRGTIDSVVAVPGSANGALAVTTTAQNLTFANAIGGTQGVDNVTITQNGNGTLNFAAAVTTAGATGVAITSAAGGGATTFSALVTTTVGAGNFNATNAASAVNLNAGAAIGGVFTSGAGLVSVTGGDLIVAGLAGSTSINVGAGGLTSNARLIKATTGNIVAAGNIAITTGANDIVASAGSITTTGTATISSTQDIIANTTITTGTGLLTATSNVQAGGAITLGGGANITGTTTTAAGDIKVTSAAGVNSAFTGAVTTAVGKGGNFDASNAAGNVVLGSAAHNIDGIVKTGAGVFSTGGNILTVANSAGVATGDAFISGAGGIQLTGGLTITKGNLNLTADKMGSLVNGALAMNGAAGSKITIGAGNGLTVGANITFGTAGGIVDLAGNTLNVNAPSVVSNADIITSVAGGTLILNAANPVQLVGNVGTTTAINAIQITGNGNIVTIGGNGATTTSVNAVATTFAHANSSLTIDASGTNTAITYSGTLDGTAANQGILAIKSGTAGVTFNGVIGGKYALNTLTHTSGTATYKGAVTTNGAVTVTAGTANFNGAVSAGGNVTLTNGTTNFGSTVTGDVVIGNAATVANFADNVNGGIPGTAAGTVTFKAAKAITVAGNAANGIGGAAFSTLGTVNLNLGGNTLTLSAGNYNANNTTFQADDTLSLANAVVFGASGLGAVTTKADNAGTIILNSNYTTSASIGAIAAGLKSVVVNSAATLRVSGGHNVYAPITGNTGKVETLGAANIGNVGTSDAPVASFAQTTAAGIVNVVSGSTAAAATGSVYAGTVATLAGGNLNATTVQATTTLNNPGTITATTVKAATLTSSGTIGATSVQGTTAFTNTGTVNLANAGTLSDVAGAGTVNLAGGANIGNIGAGTAITTLNINNANAGTVVLGGNTISATNVRHNGNVLQLTQNNTTITGIYTVGGNATIDMNGKTGFAIKGGAAVIGANKLTVLATYDPTSNNVITTAVAPTITAATGVIQISFTNGSPADGAVLNVFGVTGAALNAPLIMAGATANNVVYVANPNQTGFVSGFTYNATNVLNAAGAVKAAAGTITIQASVDTKSFAGNLSDKNVQGVSSDLADLYNSGNASGEAATFLSNLEHMTAAERAQATSDFAVHDGNVASAAVAASVATSAAQAAASATNTVIGNRITTTTADAQGIAAGDSGEKFGVWAQVIGGRATQKQRKGNSGFVSTMMGGSLGADTMISDNVSIGMLIADVANTAKLKDTSVGDKIKSNTWMFGLYGNYDIGATDFFVQGNLTVGQTAVDSKVRRLVQAGVTQTARGKYDILGVGAEVVGGYKFKFDGSYVAPSIGVRYNYFGDASYTETGLTVANQTVKTKAATQVSGLAGVRIGADVDIDGTTVKPEVHGNMSYAFNSPASKTSFKINGAQNTFNYSGAKASRFGANFGAGVMAEAEGFEYGVGYDANIADKYLAHQGSLKVKVKF